MHSTPQKGYCGAFCRGSAADVNGVWEYDTKGGAFLGQHFPIDGSPGAEPHATPLGDYILLSSGDDGKLLTVIKPGKNGEQSTTVRKIELGFGAVDRSKHAFSQAAFVEDGVRNVAVFSSTASNIVLLVDMNEFKDATSSNKITVKATTLKLSNAEDVTAIHDVRGINKRRVVWAKGTSFVWVVSAKSDEVHVIDLGGKEISGAKVIRTIPNIDAIDLVYVHSLAQDAIRSDIVRETNAVVAEKDNGQEETDTAVILSIVAIVMSAVSMALGAVMLMMIHKKTMIKKILPRTLVT